MGIKTKTAVAATFETGDKPTQAQFSDWIDSSVFIPTAGATGLIEVESTASTTNRAIGAFGVKMVAAANTAAAQALVNQPAFSTVGKAIVSASSTAAAQSVLNISFDDAISGLIETPASATYVLDQYAAFSYNIEWFAAKTSGGNAKITAKIDSTNITGIVSAAITTAESISSATGNNSVSVGNTVKLICTGHSAAANLGFTMILVQT